MSRFELKSIINLVNINAMLSEILNAAAVPDLSRLYGKSYKLLNYNLNNYYLDIFAIVLVHFME